MLSIYVLLYPEIGDRLWSNHCILKNEIILKHCLGSSSKFMVHEILLGHKDMKEQSKGTVSLPVITQRMKVSENLWINQSS